jgi:hypothetical protein
VTCHRFGLRRPDAGAKIDSITRVGQVATGQSADRSAHSKKESQLDQLSVVGVDGLSITAVLEWPYIA